MVDLTPINVGTAPNDGTGDTVREAFQKANAIGEALNEGKAELDHSHAVTDVAGLQAALDGKAASSHEHALSDLEDASAANRIVGRAVGEGAGAWTELDMTALRTMIGLAGEAVRGLAPQTGTPTGLVLLDTPAWGQIGPAAIPATVLATGRYTPTVTAVSGFSALTSASAHYTRILDTVTVSFRIVGTTSAQDQFISARMSLPIASDFAAVTDCAGSYNWQHADFDAVGRVDADATNNAALLTQWSDDNNSADGIMAGTFQYQVIA